MLIYMKGFVYKRSYVNKIICVFILYLYAREIDMSRNRDLAKLLIQYFKSPINKSNHRV